MTIEAPRRPAIATPQVGRSMRRVDGDEKLRGDARYVGDMSVPRMLHGKVLRSPVAHARIVVHRHSRGRSRMPGVVAILTGADLLDIDPYYGHAIKDRPIVAIDRVRFAGEPVAAVAATDEATAEAAVRAIVVEYEDLPIVGTIDEALAPGRRHWSTTSRCDRVPSTASARCPNAWATSATGTRSTAATSTPRSPPPTSWSRTTTPSRASTSTRWRPTASSPRWDGDGITIWATCQHPFLVRAEIAGLFDVAARAGADHRALPRAAASAASRTPRWSRSRWPWRARQAARSGSSTGSTSRWSRRAATT